MTLTLNDVWPSFCRNIQSPQTSDYDRKLNAVNLGLEYYKRRSIELLAEEQVPSDLLVIPTNITNIADVNYVELPADFYKVVKVFRKQGDLHYALDGKSLVTFDQLLTYANNNFFDTTYTGDILYAAVKEPRIYFDKHFSAIGTDNIKLSYFKNTTPIIGYNSLAVTSDTGIVAGDLITGGTSKASATVYSVDITAGTGTINYYLSGWNNVEFVSGETITTGAQTATAGATTPKPEVFDFMAKYRFDLIETFGLNWHLLKGTDEIEGRSQTVDNMIKGMSQANLNKTQMNWGYLGYV